MRSPLRLAAALALLLALTVDHGTAARWSDTGSVPGGEIRTGRVDLRVDGQDAIAGYAPLDLPRLVPGATAAAVLTVANAGNVPLQWTAATAGTNPGDALLGAVQVRMTGASSVTGSTCGGTALSGTPRDLEPGASETVCVQVGLPADAPVALAGTSTELTIAVQGSTMGWSDAATVGGVDLAAVELVPPAVRCAGLPGVDLAVSWTPVPGATEYRVVGGLGIPLGTVAAGDPLEFVLGALTGATVRAYFGGSWVSAGAGC